jgi:hypothetical protein
MAHYLTTWAQLYRHADVGVILIKSFSDLINDLINIL